MAEIGAHSQRSHLPGNICKQPAENRGWQTVWNEPDLSELPKELDSVDMESQKAGIPDAEQIPFLSKKCDSEGEERGDSQGRNTRGTAMEMRLFGYWLLSLVLTIFVTVLTVWSLRVFSGLPLLCPKPTDQDCSEQTGVWCKIARPNPSRKLS